MSQGTMLPSLERPGGGGGGAVDECVRWGGEEYCVAMDDPSESGRGGRCFKDEV